MVTINLYSMVWGGLIILGMAVFFILRRGFKPRDGIKLIALTLALLVAWVLLRPQQASTTELAQFQAQLGQGQAMLLEMQSPY